MGKWVGVEGFGSSLRVGGLCGFFEVGGYVEGELRYEGGRVSGRCRFERYT